MAAEGEGSILIPGVDENPIVRIGQVSGECHKIYAAIVDEKHTYLDAITDEGLHEQAERDLQHVMAKWKEVEGVRTSMTKPLLETKRRIDALFEKPLNWLKDAEREIKQAIANYRSLRDAAIEQERAEAARLLAESQKKVEEALVAGKPEEAAAAITAQTELAVTVQSKATPVKDLNPTYTEWKYTVNDFMTLVKAVAAGKAPAHFLQVNESVLGKYVRDLKEHTPEIPGITVYSEKTIRGKGRR